MLQIGGMFYSKLMTSNPAQSRSKIPRKTSQTAAVSAKPRSSIENLPAPIVDTIKIERRSELFSSQMWSDQYQMRANKHASSQH